MTTPDKIIFLIRQHPGSDADQLRGLGRFRRNINLYRHLSNLLLAGRVLRTAKPVSDLGLPQSGPNWVYYETGLDDSVLQLVKANPGLTIIELARVGKLDSTQLFYILEHLRCDRQALQRRREPDMRTKTILKDPVKYSLYRLTGKDLAGTAWRYYPLT